MVDVLIYVVPHSWVCVSTARRRTKMRPRDEGEADGSLVAAPLDPHDDSVAFYNAAFQSAQRLLLPRRSARVAGRLASDLLLLVCGVRDAVLWDYWCLAEEAQGAEHSAGFGFASRDEVPVSRVALYLGALSSMAPAAAALCLLHIGSSLFLVHRTALWHKIVRDEAPSDGPLRRERLVAVDAHLGSPRVCSPEERAEVVRQVHTVAVQIGCCLRAAPPEMGTSPTDTPTSAHVMRLGSVGSLLVTVHGWLLDYPVVYCYVNRSATPESASTSATASCLCSQPLVVVQLWARRKHAATSTPRPVASCPTQPRGGDDRAAAHLVCSFSTPAENVPPALVSGGYTELDALPCCRHWCSEVHQRFDRQSGWTLVTLSAETRSQDLVVL